MPPPGMPEVIVPIDYHALEMTREIQLLARDLLLHFCPPLDLKRKWTKIHRHDKAMNNGPQNGYEGGTLHADYVNNENTDASLPRYDKMQRTFGGTFIQAVDLGDGRLRCDPGVHAIDATKPMPSVETVVKNNWYVQAVSIGVNDPAAISHFPQTYIEAEDKGYPCAYPFIIDRPIHFKRDEFTTWEDEVLPDPLRIYKRIASSEWRTASGEA